jgi:hypothetical protein
MTSQYDSRRKDLSRVHVTLTRSEEANWNRANKIAADLRRHRTKGGAELAERILCKVYDATYGKRGR